MRRGKKFRIALAIAAASVCAGAAAAPVAASFGPMTITATTTLTEDQYGPITIGAENLNLDCAGHNVVGPGFVGVYLPHRTGVIVDGTDALSANTAPAGR